jgi:hypothetical protein
MGENRIFKTALCIEIKMCAIYFYNLPLLMTRSYYYGYWLHLLGKYLYMIITQLGISS